MAPPRTARCGTDAGYKRHRKLGQDACDACRQAHADYNRGYRYSVTTPPAPRRYCTNCSGETRTEHAMCSLCRKILDQDGGQDIGPEPVWVRQDGIWRAVPTEPVDEFPSSCADAKRTMPQLTTTEDA